MVSAVEESTDKLSHKLVLLSVIGNCSGADVVSLHHPLKLAAGINQFPENSEQLNLTKRKVLDELRRGCRVVASSSETAAGAFG